VDGSVPAALTTAIHINRPIQVAIGVSPCLTSLQFQLNIFLQILNAKIRRLEHLIHLKDVRIEDLHATLQHSVGLGYSTRKR
jgi:hypothetical protein